MSCWTIKARLLRSAFPALVEATQVSSSSASSISGGLINGSPATQLCMALGFYFKQNIPTHIGILSNGSPATQTQLQLKSQAFFAHQVLYPSHTTQFHSVDSDLELKRSFSSFVSLTDMGSLGGAPTGTGVTLQTNGVTSQTNEGVKKLQAMINENAKTDRGGGWEKSWQAGVTPWDAGDVTPVLADLIAKGEVPTGRALVPGCGSGYDVLALASSDRHVVGLDISSTAVEKAKRHQAAKQVPASQAELVAGDFFTWQAEGPFDVIFDYTFFCALQPDLRRDWAHRMAELLSPSGSLITLVFPIGDHEGGPPFAVNMDAYKQVLIPAGLNLIRNEPVTNSVRGREGKERLAVWKKSAAGKM